MGAADGARESNWRCRTASHLPSFLFCFLALVLVLVGIWLWTAKLLGNGGMAIGMDLDWDGLGWIEFSRYQACTRGQGKGEATE